MNGVYRLANGNTLILNNSICIEVTPDKQIVWSREGVGHGSARR
jgi:hypothetical protein